MTTHNEPRLSAQVVLQPGAEVVAEEFRKAGFQTGAIIANNFAITGPLDLFERYFNIPLRPAAATAQPGRSLPSSLPLDRLPDTIRPFVRAIGFPQGYSPTTQD